jgi:transcriptional antiterminator NusG
MISSSSETVGAGMNESKENSEYKWYAIQTYSGHELKVRERLQRVIEQESGEFGEKGQVRQVLIPTEDIYALKKGKKVKTTKRLYPGYIFVEMISDEQTLHIINGIQGVIKFLGTDRAPQSISKSEINKILGKMEEAKEAPPPDEIPFRRGDLVEVTDGPFTGFNGTVEDLYPDKGKVKVTVSLFGRPTPIVLDYVQLKAL